MVDLLRTTAVLVDAAATEVEPRALRKHVEALLDGFASASAADQAASLKQLGRGLATIEGRGAQVLALALGALVEGGAAPELAWPAVRLGLEVVLDRATAFAEAAIKRAKTPDVEAAIADSGSAVAQKAPERAHAWNATPARCLAAVACLTRSKSLRAKARKDEKLVAACWPLSDVITEVGHLLQALRTVDDETWLVLAPDLRRGWRVTVDAIASNAELYILLADVLVGDPRTGKLPGKRPDPAAVAALKAGESPAKKSAQSVTVPFHLVGWPAIAADGTLPPADADHPEHWAWIEGIPADIPFAASAKERVVLVQAPPYERPVPAVPSFDALRPSVRLAAELSEADVERTLLSLARARAKAAATAPARSPTGAASQPPASKKSAPAKEEAAARPPSPRGKSRAEGPTSKRPASKRPASKRTTKKAPPKAERAKPTRGRVAAKPKAKERASARRGRAKRS